MTVDFIAPGDSRWRHVLGRVPHDVYHLPEYAAFCARHEGGVPTAFHAASNEKEILIPLLVRPLPPVSGMPDGWSDAISPYGYPGPLVTHPDDRQWIEQAMCAFRQAARDNRLLTAFLRLHPFRGVQAQALEAAGVSLRHHGDVVYVDLTRSPEEQWTRVNHRRNVRKLLEAGFAVVFDEWSGYEGFGPLYRRTMDRVNATPFYFFSDAYFRDLRETLDARLHLSTVISPQGELAAAGLFIETGGIIQYHLGGTACSYRARAPSKLMFDHVRRWGSCTGAAILNLGGGIGGRTDALFDFKAGFSQLRAPFHTARVVSDPPLYAAVSRSALPSHVVGSDPDFFPVYRAPHAASRCT
jgi:hypothetical protein